MCRRVLLPLPARDSARVCSDTSAGTSVRESDMNNNEENGKPTSSELCAATLCVDVATAETVRQAVMRKEGTFAGEMQQYWRDLNDEILLQRLQRAEVAVCIIDFDRERSAAVEAANAIQQLLHGRGCLMAVSSRADPSLILEAMRAGCSEYLTKPVAVDQVGEALDRLRLLVSTRKPPRARHRGRILVLLGARGGAGTTTLAVHLGSYLVRQHNKKALLLDAHRRFGHVSLYLGEDNASYHFYELVRNISRLDETLLQGFVIHHSSALDILPSPDFFDESSNVSLDDVQRTIRFLAEYYEFVLIDCPNGVHNLSETLIDCCDELYMVTTPDVPGIRDLSRYIDRLLQSNVVPTKIKVVINRFSSQGALTLEQIEKAIRQPIAITVPNATAELVRAMNSGSPVPPERKSDFTIQMKKWVASLAAGDEAAELAEPRRRFAFWN